MFNTIEPKPTTSFSADAKPTTKFQVEELVTAPASPLADIAETDSGQLES